MYLLLSQFNLKRNEYNSLTTNQISQYGYGVKVYLMKYKFCFFNKNWILKNYVNLQSGSRKTSPTQKDINKQNLCTCINLLHYSLATNYSNLYVYTYQLLLFCELHTQGKVSILSHEGRTDKICKKFHITVISVMLTCIFWICVIMSATTFGVLSELTTLPVKCHFFTRSWTVDFAETSLSGNFSQKLSQLKWIQTTHSSTMNIHWSM